MGQKIDLSGKKFGYLTIISEGDRDNDGNIKWNCLCDCGNTTQVRSNLLRRGTTVSCGCYQRKQAGLINRKHGLYKHPLYLVHAKMKARCYDPKQAGYYRYGGRGITICQRWLSSFEDFYEDVVVGYEKGLQLDRINNNGNYEPDNVRWVTPQQNGFNKGAETTSSSKYKGVSWCNSRNNWVVQISRKGKKKTSKRFESEVDAAIFYNLLATEYFGEHAYLNEVEITD